MLNALRNRFKIKLTTSFWKLQEIKKNIAEFIWYIN